MNLHRIGTLQIKYITVAIMITMTAFAYTFIIALLFAEDYMSINYQFNSGISATLLGWLTVWIVFKIDLLMHSWMKKSSLIMFAVNLLISLLVCSGFIFVTSWLLNITLRDNYSLNFAFFKEQILIINFLLLLIMGYHTIAYFTRTISKQNKLLKADNLELSNALHKYLLRVPSTRNKKTSLIPIEEVMFFRIESGVIFAHLSNGQRSSIQISTLNNLETKLNPAIFFRINRSELVNIEKVNSFEPYFKDRLSIKLTDQKTTLHTSNARSAKFKKWLIGG